jgi:threonine/homoserine/homoserine lactone efflux protein
VPAIHDLGLFVLAGVMLNMTPGVDFLYVLGRSTSRGFAAGVWASLGIGAGCFVHVTAAALGLSAILASSAAAFAFVKWVGAAYLIYLGIGMIRQRVHLPAAPVPADVASEPGQGRSGRIFWQGFATNVLNPKVALFFLAFVPQFIDVHGTGKVQAFLLLGTIFNTTGTLWNLFVAWSSATVARRLAVAARLGRWLNRTLGAMFIALGVKLALTERA